MSKHIPEIIREISRERAPQFFNLTRKVPPPKIIEIGQIWSTQSTLMLPEIGEVITEEPRLIVILSTSEDTGLFYDQVTAVPISMMIWAATNFDLLVPIPESSLPYQYMVEVWNETPVLRAHLRTYIGKLSDNAVKVMRSVHLSLLLDENLPQKAQEWVGLPIIEENDLRVAFQEAEVEAVQYLANAATAALFADLPSPVAEPARKKRFQVQPVFSNVEKFLKGSRRAFAAGHSTTSDIVVSTSSGEDAFVLQILERRRETLIYALVHEVSPSLEGLSFVITVVLREQEIRSVTAIMRTDEQITIGNVLRFDKNDIVLVNIDFE